MTTAGNAMILDDTDKLPPTQMLILETLAGRWRTGEDHWTFHPKLGKAMEALRAAGLVEFWERSDHRLVAKFTERSRASMTKSDYKTPVQLKIEKLERRIQLLEQGYLDQLADRLAPLVIELITSRQPTQGGQL